MEKVDRKILAVGENEVRGMYDALGCEEFQKCIFPTTLYGEINFPSNIRLVRTVFFQKFRLLFPSTGPHESRQLSRRMPIVEKFLAPTHL